MPKKKTPKNAFYYFMLDFKEEQERHGVHFYNGLKEVADYAGPEWNKLTPAEKQPYEERAAVEKSKSKLDLTQKFTTMGTTYAQLEAERNERLQKEMNMKSEITTTVQMLDRDTTLKTHVFYFVHFNYYCRVENGDYLPCEVAVAQFNLFCGVKEVFHSFIRHEKIPTGYGFEALSRSNETHQIPLPEALEYGEKWRHGALFYLLRSFLEQNKMPNNALPPLYAVTDHVEIAQDILNDLALIHYPNNPDIFRVYPLSKLFFLLRNACSYPGTVGFPKETIAERELEKDCFNFAPGIACDMHVDNDSCVFCSKSIVTRWAFLICDHCCKDLNIPLQRGKHIPVNALIKENEEDEERFKEVRPKEKPMRQSSRGQPERMPAWSKKDKEALPPVTVRDYGRDEHREETAHSSTCVTSQISSPAEAEGNCWGPRSQSGVLRWPNTLPQTVNSPSFSEADFPGLGSKGRSNTPAAIAKCGRGRARLLQEAQAPGGLNEEKEAPSIPGFGRGRGKKPGSRLAINLQDLQLE